MRIFVPETIKRNTEKEFQGRKRAVGNRRGLRIRFGKYKGELVRVVPTSYLNFLLAHSLPAVRSFSGLEEAINSELARRERVKAEKRKQWRHDCWFKPSKVRHRRASLRR